MATHYCAHADISAFLQVDAFHATDTTPTIGTVEMFIGMAEKRINRLTKHAWNNSSSTYESVTEERGRVQRVRTNALNNVGRIQLSHYPVLAFTQHATTHNLDQTNGNLKVWNGSAYIEYLDSDLAEMGTITSVANKDFWVDTQRGIIYLEKFNLSKLSTFFPNDLETQQLFLLASSISKSTQGIPLSSITVLAPNTFVLFLTQVLEIFFSW